MVMTMTQDKLDRLSRLADLFAGLDIDTRTKHTTPTGTPQGPYMFGPGGLLSYPGIKRDLISLRVQPKGLASRLPGRPTTETDPLYGYITGFLGSSGADPAGVCDDGRVAGPMKDALQTATFGRYTRMTREFEIIRQGQQTNRGEFLDLRVLNDPLLQPHGGNGIVDGGIPGAAGNPSLRREALVRFMEVGISFQNLLSNQLYIGNPANNNSGGGYKEFPGLDILIGTNKKDAVSGVSVPALNSTIINYNFGNLNAPISANNDIVNVVTNVYRQLKYTAQMQGLDPVNWAIVMRQSMFWQITALWPCSYLTTGCSFRTTDGTQILNVSANDQIAMRDAMRQGKYLLIDGEQVEIVIDDAITELTNTTSNRLVSGAFASDMYFVPLTFAGGLAATYWEYMDMSQTAMQAVSDGPLAENFFWSDGGQYIWHFKPPKNWCVQWIGMILPRIILLVPHLAARIQNIQYQPLIHEKEPFPNQPYFVNGGVSTGRPAPSFYADYKV